jgi:hypothetical protein
LYTAWVPALKPWKECGNCDVGGGKKKEMYLLLRMKVLKTSPLLCLQSLHAAVCQVLPNGNSRTANSVHVIVHRLCHPASYYIGGLVSNIIKADNSCIHHISNRLLIGCHFSLFQLLSWYLSPQGFIAQNHTVDTHLNFIF